MRRFLSSSRDSRGSGERLRSLLSRSLSCLSWVSLCLAGGSSLLSLLLLSLFSLSSLLSLLPSALSVFSAFSPSLLLSGLLSSFSFSFSSIAGSGFTSGYPLFFSLRSFSTVSSISLLSFRSSNSKSSGEISPTALGGTFLSLPFFSLLSFSPSLSALSFSSLVPLAASSFFFNNSSFRLAFHASIVCLAFSSHFTRSRLSQSCFSWRNSNARQTPCGSSKSQNPNEVSFEVLGSAALFHLLILPHFSSSCLTKSSDTSVEIL